MGTSFLMILKDDTLEMPSQGSAHGLSGFSLLELVSVLAIIGFLTTTVLFTFDGLLERWRVNQASDQVIQTLKHAQFLALTQRRSHGIKGSGTQLWITPLQQLSNTAWVTLPEQLTLSANRWPSFSPFGFANAGTISLESQRYSLQIKVGPIGSIRSTPLQSK